VPFQFTSWLAQKLARDEPAAARIPAATGQRAAPFRGVAIKTGSQCCEAAKQLQGARFLSASAPRLPLPDCGAAACRCRYVHFQDRRSGDDRRGPDNWHRHHLADADRRRQRQGRRETDEIAWEDR
jgi:hypothetical protein